MGHNSSSIGKLAVVVAIAVVAAVVMVFCLQRSSTMWNQGPAASLGNQANGPPAAERHESASPGKLPCADEPRGTAADAHRSEEARFSELRQLMVERQLRGRDIVDRRVLSAMGSVPRQCFVPEALRDEAYADYPLPIGHGQTISQPYIVALMTQLARPSPQSKALDVGTGSGYQAAVLAEICKEVYSIEILEPLARQAADRLAALGYKNVVVRHGDGYRGWPEKAPFDVIIVAAAPDHVPQPLVDQLAPGGRLVLPVGDYYQELVVVEKLADGTIRRTAALPVRFVPMTGEAAKGPHRALR